MSDYINWSFAPNPHPTGVYNEQAEKHIVGSAASDSGISSLVCWRHIYTQSLNQMKQSNTNLTIEILIVIYDFGYSFCYKIPVLLFI